LFPPVLHFALVGQIQSGGLCKENQSQALLYQRLLCRAFHNVRLSITSVRVAEFPNFEVRNEQAPQPDAVSGQNGKLPVRLSQAAINDGWTGIEESPEQQVNSAQLASVITLKPANWVSI
jgi:hypothetical protein